MAPSQEPFNFWQALKSVLCAFFGVQSQENMEKDFKQKSPYTYIMIGVFATVVFVLCLYLVVQVVIK